MSKLIWAICWTLFLPGGQLHDRIEWLTGRDFDRALRSSDVSVDWQQVHFRNHLFELSRLHRVAVFLDRRLDPTAVMDLRVTGVNLEMALWRMAAERQAAIFPLDGLVYFGPPEATVRLATVLDRFSSQLAESSLSESQRRPWMAVRAWEFRQPIEPREALLTICREANVSLDGVSEIPHDLWHPFELPPLPLYETVIILLAGFDLTIACSPADGVHIVQYPTEGNVTRRFANLPDSRRIAERLRQQDPHLQVSVQSNSVSVTGTSAAILVCDQFVAAQRDAQRRPGPRGESRFSLKTRAQRGAIIASLARQLEIPWNCPESERTILEQTIDLEVENVTAEKLLTEALKGTGLSFRGLPSEIQIIRQ